jgi:DNA polymerase I-like protein with 3'-5' exonuclease and polymerase domains
MPNASTVIITPRSRFRRVYKSIRLIDGVGPCNRNVSMIDHGAMPMISRMAQTGLQVDLDHFVRMESTLILDMERIVEEVHDTTEYYINPGSGDQVADLLFKKLKLKQARPKMTASGDRESVEDAVLTAIQHDHPVVPLLQDYKEFEKLLGTYVRPIMKLAVRVRGGEWRMFPNFNHTRVTSGRLSCKDPNLLAMPTRTDRGREIRQGFITKQGWKIVSVDESQIEVRMAAHRSKDANLIRVYQNEEDIYSDFATFANRLEDKRYRDVDGWHYPAVDKMKHRRPCKICVLASIYDVTAMGLQDQMPVVCARCNMEGKDHTHKSRQKAAESSKPVACNNFYSLWQESQCQDIINKFYMKYPGLIAMRRNDHAYMRKHACIVDMWGRLLHSQGVRSVHDWVAAGTLREGSNHPMQCLPARTRILTSRGYERIGDFVSGEVWTGEKWSNAKRVDKGIGQLVELTTQDGATFICDTSHKLLVANTCWPTWHLAKDLRAGDVLSSVLPSIRCEGTKEQSPEFWYWIGRYYGDGHLTYDKFNRRYNVSWAFGCHEIDKITELRRFLEFEYGKSSICVNEKKGGCLNAASVAITSYRMNRTMESLGITPNEYAWTKRVAPVVFTLDLVRRTEFLKGYFDADGSRPRKYEKGWSAKYVTSTSLGLLQDTQLLFRSVGEFTKILGPYLHKGRGRPFYRLLLGQDPNSLRRVKTVKILEDREKVYTLSVEDLRHCYDSEGLISKNSGAQGTLKITMQAVNDDLESCGESIWDVVHPLLQVHDELLFEVRDDMADEVAAMTKWRFESLFEGCFAVDIKASEAKAQSWGDLPK